MHGRATNPGGAILGPGGFVGGGAAPILPFAADDFAGLSTGTDLNGRAATGGSWVRHGSVTSGRIVGAASGEVRSNFSGSSLYYLNATPPSADYAAELTIRVLSLPSTAGQAAACGPCVRVQSGANTFYTGRYLRDVSNVIRRFDIYRFVSGTATLLRAGGPRLAVSDVRTLRLEVRTDGSHALLRLLADGTEVLNFRDQSPITGAGFAGIRFFTTPADDATRWFHGSDFEAYEAEPYAEKFATTRRFYSATFRYTAATQIDPTIRWASSDDGQVFREVTGVPDPWYIGWNSSDPSGLPDPANVPTNPAILWWDAGDGAGQQYYIHHNRRNSGLAPGSPYPFWFLARKPTLEGPDWEPVLGRDIRDVLPNAKVIFAGNWVVDDDGTVWLTPSISDNTGLGGPFQTYLMRPDDPNDFGGTWTTPVQVVINRSGSPVANLIDTTFAKIGSTWYCVYKDEGTPRGCYVASSSTLAGPYTTQGTILATEREAPEITRLAGGIWRLYTDDYSSDVKGQSGYGFFDATVADSLTDWPSDPVSYLRLTSAPLTLPEMSVLRHGGIGLHLWPGQVSASHAGGGTVDLTASEGAVGASAGPLAHQWEYSADGSSWSDLSGQTGLTGQATGLGSGTHHFRMRYTNSFGDEVWSHHATAEV